MANLFTRHHNDSVEINSNYKANKDINSIIMDKSVNDNKYACYSNSSFINAQSQAARPMTSEGVLDLGVKTDIETRLQNRHKELNSMERTNKDYEKYPTKMSETCIAPLNVTNEDSRFTNPIVNYREMNTSEYNFNPYLFIDFQKVVVDNTIFLPPTRNGESSRFDSKKGKYSLKPKEFATIKPVTNYSQIIKNSDLLPNRKAISSGKKAYEL
jgi:hypothetical protein